MDFINELEQRWLAEAEQLEHRGRTADADFVRSFIEDLTREHQRWLEETLTLEAAADESGYSGEHLARLVRQATIPNAGKLGTPRICRRHLPRKPGCSLEAANRGRTNVDSRTQMARSVVESN